MNDVKESVSHKIVFAPRVMINSLLGLALFIIVMINLFSFHQASKFFKANQWVIHTYKVINTINEVFLNLVKIESAARGFIITNNQNNLQDMGNNKNNMYQKITEAKSLTIDNMNQQQKLVLLHEAGKKLYLCK